MLDSNLGDAVARLPWLENGVDFEESFLTRHMAHLASADTDTARTAASLAWLADEPTVWASQAIKALANLAHTDPQLAESVVVLPWFSNDITAREDNILGGLTNISSTDPELAKRIISSSRFSDDISEFESYALGYLGEIALRDPELASHWGEYAINSSGDLVLFGISGIFEVMDWAEDSWDRLTEQPWFTDGLENEEIALVSVLGPIIRGHPQLYNDLAQTPFTQSATVSLPLTGEVNLFVLQPKPFPPGEDLVAML